MINTIGGYSQAARKGVSGLATGLDTDELVKGMTISTRTKIAKQYQNRDMLTWKAEAYQGVSSKLVSFADKYLSYTSKTNMLSASFFDGTSVKSMGKYADYFTGSGDISAAKDLSIVGIDSLSKAASFTNKYQVTDNIITSGQLNFGEQSFSNLAGETINISYGGQIYNVTIGEDLPANADYKQIVDAFNDALAKVDMDTKKDGIQPLSEKISLGLEGTDKFKIYGNNLSDQTSFYIAGGTRKAIDALNIEMGVNGRGGKSIVGSPIDKEKLNTTVKFNDALRNQSITFEFNGAARTIKFGEDIDFKNIGDFKTYLQNQFDSVIGSGKIIVGNNGNKLSFEVADKNSSFSYMGASGANITGFKGVLHLEKYDMSKLNIANNLEDAKFKTKVDKDGVIKINGKEFSYKATDSIKSIWDKINNDLDANVTIKYLETSNTFSIVSDETGVQGKISVEDVSGNLTQAMFGINKVDDTNSFYVKGSDATISYKVGNGPVQTISRSTNSFNINGFSVKLTDKAMVGDISADPVRFETTADNKEIVDAVRKMVDDYNEIVALVNKEVSTKRDRAYTALTDEQKETMTEKQIENWESKAKAGILFGDAELRSLSSQMRFAFSFDVPGLDSLSEMGITTSTSYSDNGKLIFDEKKFAKALEENPSKVKDAFTRTQSKEPGASKYDAGLMTRVKAVTDAFAKTTGEKGTLIRMAGLPNSLTYTDSYLYKQISEIDKTITRLNKSLLKEEERYYSQFTRLEQLTAQMNAQASWLQQQ